LLQCEKISEKGVSYVEPLKDKAYYTIIRELELKDDETAFLEDEIIEVKYTETVKRNQCQKRDANQEDKL
jgi:hypothetical protein